ncbi:hypothetical protein [Mycetohabitans sp. B46]|uniref:hypothetical protein n=1 Tax=Mycetohabitans sp. B46 TaxID=2772536 RepID=UPI00307D317B
MDFDLNALLNLFQSHTYVVDTRPKPAASAPPPPSSGVLTNLPTRQLTTYRDLPPELIARIGEHLPVQDVMSFSTVDWRTYRAMEAKREIYRYWQQARQTVSLESMNQLLDEMGGALKNLAPHAEPLDALRQRLQALPENEQVDAFKRVFATAQHIPQDGVRIQKAMLPTLRDFPWHRRAELFDFVYAMAEQRSPGQDNIWTSLTSGLWALPFGTSPFVERYQVLLARLPLLSVAEQAELIPELSGLLFHFNEGDPRISGLYAVLHEHALRLPPSHQGAPVGALAGDTWVLPKAERHAQYIQMRDRALALPDEQWAIALRYLPKGLDELLPNQQVRELTLLERHLARVPEAQRTHVAVGLLQCIQFMDETLSKQVWRQALSLLNGADEAAFWDVLSELREKWILFSLGPDHWRLAIVEIKRFMKTNGFSKTFRKKIQDSSAWLKSRPS